MAHRRRAFYICYCSSGSLSSVLVHFKERTSFVISTFAQSRLRRFTELNFGVSLRAFDADLFSVYHRRSVSLLPSVTVGSFSEAADLHQNGKSFDLAVVAPCFSDARHLLPSSSATTSWIQIGECSPDPESASSISRIPLISLAVEETLVCQVLGLYWALKLMGQFFAFCLLGRIVTKPLPASPLSPRSIFSRSLLRCRERFCDPLAILFCLFHQLFASQDFFLDLESRWWLWYVFLLFLPVLISRRNLEFATAYLLHWRLFAKHLVHHGSSVPSRYQTSFCRGQERSFPSSSLFKERTFSPLYSSILLCLLYHCPWFAWSALVWVECSEASLSVIFNGSTNWCFVAFNFAANVRFATSALGAVSSWNNQSLLVLIVPHGAYSLLVSNVIKVQGLQDDVYYLSVRIACLYPSILCVVVLCLAYVATMPVALLARILSPVTLAPLGGD